eukprot:6163030-Amphidinium_carterae.1
MRLLQPSTQRHGATINASCHSALEAARSSLTALKPTDAMVKPTCQALKDTRVVVSTFGKQIY